MTISYFYYNNFIKYTNTYPHVYTNTQAFYKLGHEQHFNRPAIGLDEGDQDLVICPKSNVKSLMDFKRENPQSYLHFSR